MLIDTREQARRLGVSVPTVREWVRGGVIPVIKINANTWRFDPGEVEEALKRRAGKGGRK